MHSPSDRTVLLTFAAGHMANDWAVGAIWLVAPALAVALDLGPSEVGLLLTIYGIGGAFAYLPAGLLADRLSARGGLLLATFWWVAIGHLAASLAPGYWSFALVMAVAIMGDAAWHPVATGYLVQRFPQRRAQVLGIHAMGGTIGAEVLAPLGVGAVLAVADWRTALQVAALPALIMGVVFIFIAPRLKPLPARSTNLDIKGLLAPWKSRTGVRLMVTMVLYNMAAIAVVAMMPLYLQVDVGLGPMAVALLFAGTLLLGSLAQPWAGQLSDRYGRRAPILGGLGIGAGAALFAGLANDANLVIAGLIAAGAILTAIRSVVLAAAIDITRERESATLALAFTVLDGVGAVGALLAGIAAEADLSYAFVLAAVLSGGSCIVGAGLRKT
jgi:MFS transporter, FSR family, fosmidomycin resistance protein